MSETSTRREFLKTSIVGACNLTLATYSPLTAMRQTVQTSGVASSHTDPPSVGHKVLPPSLQCVEDYFSDIHVPEDLFIPNGYWENHYSIWVVTPNLQKLFKWVKPATEVGSLRIRRRSDGKNRIKLEVTRSERVEGATKRCDTNVQIVCKWDQLSTPMEWKSGSRLYSQARMIEDLQTWTTGKIDGEGKVILQHRKPIKLRRQFTSNWSLFDAIQRMPLHESEPVSFDLLDEMDLRKPGQSLAYRESVTVVLGGSAVNLHGFDQIGKGILPISYWVDDRHRLIIVCTGMCYYILNHAQ